MNKTFVLDLKSRGYAKTNKELAKKLLVSERSLYYALSGKGTQKNLEKVNERLKDKFQRLPRASAVVFLYCYNGAHLIKLITASDSNKLADAIRRMQRSQSCSVEEYYFRPDNKLVSEEEGMYVIKSFEELLLSDLGSDGSLIRTAYTLGSHAEPDDAETFEKYAISAQKSINKSRENYEKKKRGNT